MARSILHSRLLTLRTLVAAMVAVLVFQAAYVTPVAAASAPARAIGPVVPHAAPPAVETPVLDPAHEVVTARTETTRTYDLGNGRRAVEAFPDPIFYQPEGSTDWQPIDLGFTTTDNGTTASVTRSPVAVTVGEQADGFVALEHKGRRIALRPIPLTPGHLDEGTKLPGTVPAGSAPGLAAKPQPVELLDGAVIDGLDAPVTAGDPTTIRQRADLPDVLRGVGLRVFVHAYGTSNFLVLAERPTGSSWTFAVKAKGLTLVPGVDGALQFVDETGGLFATMQAPYAVDSTPDEHAGGGRTTTDAWYTLSSLGSQQLVTVSVDPTWLAEAVYPVYVDPSVVVYNDGDTTYGDTHVNEGNKTYNYANYKRPDAPGYFEMWLGESPTDSTYWNWDFLRFDLRAYDGTVVESATLEVYPYHQYYNAPTTSRVYLRRVTQTWTEAITWNTQPGVTSDGMRSADCVEGVRCAFDITYIARDWRDGDTADFGVRLDEVDSNETRKGPTYWKRIISGEHSTTARPRVTLVYRNPVTVVSPDGGVTARTAGRTLSWATETGWGQDAYRVDVSTSSTFATTLVTSGDVTSSTAREWAIPTTTTLTPGTTYYWRVKARRTTTRTPTPTTMWSLPASGSFTWDPGANLGMQSHHTFESFDLGAGDGLAVNVATGNLVLTHPIVSLPVRGGSVSIDLAYNSFDTASVGFGPGWRTNLDRRLESPVWGSTITFTDGDGARHPFTWVSGTSSYQRPATIYATLTQQGSGFKLAYRGGAYDLFTSAGLLAEERDRFGNGVTLDRTVANQVSVQDAAGGRSIVIAYVAGRVSAITDWAYVNDAGEVQATATGSPRKSCFFYDGSSRLAGWTDPLYAPTSACPGSLPAASHATRLTYAAGTAALVSAIAKTQTVEGAGATALTTTTRTITTEIAYRGDEVASITDAEQQSKGALAARTVFSRPVAAQVLVKRYILDGTNTALSETKYGLVSASDALARVQSVWRKLGSAWIEERTTYDATYPTEVWQITANNGGTPSRTVTTTYAAGTMGLVARVVEPLDGNADHDRWTDYAYNAAGDVTQTIVREANSTAESQRTVTVNCWGAHDGSLPEDRRTCPTGTGLHLVRTISRFVSGASVSADTNVATDIVNDTYGRRLREVRADGVVTGWTYDNLGNQTAEIRNYSDGSVTVANEQPGDSDIDPLASAQARTDLTTAFAFDTAGNRVSTADPRRAIGLVAPPPSGPLGPDDYVNRATFDALGQQLSERTPTTPGVLITQKTAITTYDELGNTLEVVDFGGLVSGTAFDRAGRAEMTYEDTASGNPDVTADPTLDAAGRVTSAKDRRQVDDASLGATVTAFDELGRTTSVTEAWTNPITPLASITTTSYDALDRVLLEETGVGDTYITGQRTTYTYDLGGRVLATDDEFACTTKAYDWRDLVTRETSGLQGGTCTSGGDTREVTHLYDALGRLTSSEVTAGTGDGDILEAATYDAAGRRLSTSATASGVTTATSFDFNPLDEVRTETRSAGGTTTTWTKTTHDPAGNPTDRCTWSTDPGSAACLSVGQAITPALAVRSTTSYDARNNRLSLADGAANTTTMYDPDHNYLPRAFYVPTGTGRELQTLYEYDSRHRLDDPATTQVPGILHQLCILEGATPDPHGCSSTTTLGSDAYLHDDNDNRTKVVEANGSTSSDRRYCYDGLNRLRARNTGSGCTLTSGDETFTYDDAGNRLTAPGVTATYDAEGQLATCTGCGTISHDSAGRITALAGWTYAYDAEGRLLVATETASGDRLEMTYDAEGHRTKVITTEVAPNPDVVTIREFRYQGDAIVEEKVTDAAHLTPGTIVRTYTVTDAGQVVSMTIPAGEPGADPFAPRTYLPTWNGHGDALALWRHNADGSLTLANSYTYGTWGSPATATHNGIPDLGFRFLYVGAADVQWDDFSGAGLLYMHARHYSPLTGRFLQPDPIAAETNLYGYAGNNPITASDPSGTCAIFCIVLVGVIIFGGLGAAFSVGNYMMITPSERWQAHQMAKWALRGFFEQGSLALVPIGWWRVGRAAAFSRALPRWYFRLSVHAVAERMALRGVTRAMVAKTLQYGTMYWDPLNRTVAFVLRRGMASGHDILVARNPLTGTITTVITGTNLVSSRFVYIGR